jgi:hypothetical protein
MTEALLHLGQRTRQVFALAGVLLAPLQASAQITDEDMCRNGAFPRQTEFHIARVGGDARQRLQFYVDYDGCPAKGERCQTGAYVVGGDKLLLGKTHGEWTCAWYEGKKHETVGWVRNSALVEQVAAEPVEWTGNWKEYDHPGYISIARKAGTYHLVAETRWIGQNTENLGEMGGELKVNRDRAHYGGDEKPGNYECVADFTRIDDFLIVRDNANCGGMNVRFNGVYTRVR